ncbi:unnamed protein product [Mytilus coruscus]|uniref:Uncharacterized protein n=1 Tax=Mytilus coruscus TaxID=42192 RepID=A0A6J8EEB4_MYTCO|nr:unnamed protein product [Mytilus coruscus]
MAAEIASTENKANRLKSKYTSKVFPAKTTKGEDISVLQDDGHDTETQEDSNGFALMFATKNKKKQAALKLIDSGADIHFLDQTKCNVLHYAAGAGYDGLILKLLSKGTSVNLQDCNGETALHKAARSGHEKTVVALVANDADVYVLNWQGQTCLELAVMGRHVKIIEDLCLFGSDLVMQDWQWLEEAIQSRDKEDQTIVDIFMKHNYRLLGFKHGGITFDAKYIESGSDTYMKKIGVTLLSKKSTHQPYYFYCSRIHVEYINVQKYISKGEKLFSDTYECKAWGSSRTTFNLKLKLNGIPNCNETLKVISPNGNVANIDSSSRNEETNHTYVIVTVNIKHGAVVTFMFVTIKKPEVFGITKRAVTIQPQLEPDAEIDIPKDTFDSPGDLLFNVVETKDVSIDDGVSNREAFIVTNVIDLSMSNHQQPKQPIDVKLPMHSTTNEDNDIVILTSSKEYPEKIKDWEIIEAKKDKNRASFRISHFSIFTGVSKKKVETDMIGVCKSIQKALNNERQVEFFALAKTLSSDEYAIVIECALQRKASKRKKEWEKQQFSIQKDEGRCHTVQINQWFRVKFDGNIKIAETEQSDTQRLMFHPNRDNFHIFSAELFDKRNPPTGRIEIELIVETEQEPIIVLESENCFKSKETVITRDPITTYMNLTSLPMHLLPVPTAPVENIEVKVFQPLTDNDCMIKVLKMNSLKELAKRLSMDEAEQVAIQLKLTQAEVAALARDFPKIDDFCDAVFWKWRGKRPYGSQAMSLAVALERSGKALEAAEVKAAHKEDRLICFD